MKRKEERHLSGGRAQAFELGKIKNKRKNVESRGKTHLGAYGQLGRRESEKNFTRRRVSPVVQKAARQWQVAAVEKEENTYYLGEELKLFHSSGVGGVLKGWRREVGEHID